MGNKISIGKQDFCSLREKRLFYVDKTYFIKEWWEADDDVTLITRPRRFGKTLNMSMLECFFSNRYEGRADLFEGLSIWEEEKYRKLQGSFPVIFLSFAAVKAGNLEDAKMQIKMQIENLYAGYRYLLEGDMLTENERKQFLSMEAEMPDAYAATSVNRLCNYLSRCYGKKVIVLLDEYDTPMQEAYLKGYWEEFTDFVRSFFNSTFKTNPYLERAIMTGITRISKKSIFSDLNNPKIVTTTCNEYAACFGFTEQEVFDSLEAFGMSGEKADVKDWYDGFTFGDYTDIYNPWSITNFLDRGRYETYWASTSSNGLVSQLIQSGTAEVKCQMEELLNGDNIRVDLDEQVVFSQLGKKRNAIWSLLLASGYLKIVEKDIGSASGRSSLTLALTNREVRIMFDGLIRDWFDNDETPGNAFLKSMLAGDLEAMNHYMNKIALATFSYFDTGRASSGDSEPERFYHGFVLGLLVEFREKYEIISNGESGFGRYDIMMVPRQADNPKTPGFVIEFKVHHPEKEKDLEETVKNALKQIDEKPYDARILCRGVKKENIRHYGFAFEGKKVLIGS